MTQKTFHKILTNHRYIPDKESTEHAKFHGRHKSLKFSSMELSRMKKMREENRLKKKRERETKKEMKKNVQSSMKHFFSEI